MWKLTGYGLSILLFMRALQASDRGFTSGAIVLGILSVTALVTTIYSTHKENRQS